MEPVTDGGVRFGLSENTFERWWSTAITPEDGERAVHIYLCHMVHCRFVCALDMLRTQNDQHGDLIVRAYLLAAEIPEELAREHRHRLDAQIVFDFPGVQWLLDQVTYRAERQARERLSKRTVRRLEKLYEKTETDELLVNPDIQRVVLGESNRFLATAQRAKDAEDARREKTSLARAIAAAQKQEVQSHALPNKTQALAFLHMMREEMGEAEFASLLSEAAPKKLK